MSKQPWKIAAALTLSLGLAGAAWADDDDDEIPFDVASLYFELNDTDGDLGIHALIDGEEWRRLRIEDPNGRRMLDVAVRGRLGRQGMTELFFESAEPTFDELPPAVFFDRFPEGSYEIEGITLEGDELESEVFLSHVIPAPAPDLAVNGEPAADGCDGELPSVSPPVTISWSPAGASHPELGKPGDVEVEHHEIVVEEEVEERVLKVLLPPDTTSFEIPSDFIDLEAGEGFKFEVLVRADTGNQTATESCFELE